MGKYSYAAATYGTLFFTTATLNESFYYSFLVVGERRGGPSSATSRPVLNSIGDHIACTYSIAHKMLVRQKLHTVVTGLTFTIKFGSFKGLTV